MEIRIIRFKCLFFLTELYLFTKATIFWEIETIPAVFGKDVILKCTLPDNSFKKMQSRRWLGKKDRHLLSMNGVSIDPGKYSEVFNKENKTSLLIIHDFDIMDINVPYECVYGSSTFVKILNLTEKYFEYHTSGSYIDNIAITETNVLSVNISTEKVYPRPKCSAAINDEDISAYMTTTTILKELFFFAIINVTYILTPASCSGLLSITCNIGTYIFVYETNITCNKIESDNNKEISSMNPSVTIIVSVIGCVILLATFVYFIKKQGPNIILRLEAEEYSLTEIDILPRRKIGARVKIK